MNSNDKKKKMKKRKASTDVRVVAETVETRQVKGEIGETEEKKRKSVESISHIDDSNGQNDDSEECNDSIPEEQFSVSGGINKSDAVTNGKKGKSKNTERKKRKGSLCQIMKPSDSLLETREEIAEDEVYQMSSGDEDYSKGMKKWITHYHQSRPGLNVLQQRIDDFIMAHEAREEQAKAEKLAQAAEGGWTVVVHQKGRKKTTEADSGIAVGSVAQAAVLDKMGKKKKKEVGLDFYQFNRREAHRNEIMMLQSKFEQDKKRIQQMRAARKFRPY
ncbi:uncharacterized protein LOC121754846 [Salvia splendens]|uniref:uncharacterized protein LOC121754846 n=1 Tax=Salvia splendens TaxID=180675 RepID=UPI001C271371|nr:uncharacterized protein LOC121754846 [Salvia splendens]